MKLRNWLWPLAALVVGACAARSPGPGPVRARAVVPESARSAKPVAWSARAPEDRPWRITKRLQLVTSPGRTRGEHFAWVIANGNQLLRVYQVSSRAELAALVGAVSLDRIDYAEGSAYDNPANWGVAGSIIKIPPPPPPPEPGGFPLFYLEQVFDAAQAMDQAQNSAR